MLTMLGILAAGVSGGTACAGGGDQVRGLRLDADRPIETWHWTARAARDVPADYRDRPLAHIDECKAVDDGRAVLVTASTGGAVPGGRITIAPSITPDGDRLQLYDRRRSARTGIHLYKVGWVR